MRLQEPGVEKFWKQSAVLYWRGLTGNGGIYREKAVCSLVMCCWAVPGRV